MKEKKKNAGEEKKSENQKTTSVRPTNDFEGWKDFKVVADFVCLGEEGSKKNKEPDLKKTETASEKPDEKKDGKQKKSQGKGTEDKSGHQGDLEEEKSKAHAMYMKFWRSTRSR